MNKLLLIFAGFMCCLSVSFGQNLFEVPLSSNVFETTTAFLDTSVFELKKVGTTFYGKSESVVVEGYRQITSSKSELSPIAGVTEVNFSEGSNMPIIDLSIGYSSNFPIKEFSKNFRANMPITELKSPKLIILPQKDE